MHMVQCIFSISHMYSMYQCVWRNSPPGVARRAAVARHWAGWAETARASWTDQPAPPAWPSCRLAARRTARRSCRCQPWREQTPAVTRADTCRSEYALQLPALNSGDETTFELAKFMELVDSASLSCFSVSHRWRVRVYQPQSATIILILVSALITHNYVSIDNLP